jgi:hypothetical protein
MIMECRVCYSENYNFKVCGQCRNSVCSICVKRWYVHCIRNSLEKTCPHCRQSDSFDISIGEIPITDRPKEDEFCFENLHHRFNAVVVYDGYRIPNFKHKIDGVRLDEGDNVLITCLGPYNGLYTVGITYDTPCLERAAGWQLGNDTNGHEIYIESGT